MNFYLFAIFSYSIFVAAGLGLSRLKKVNTDYYPFIIYTILASFNEIYSYIIVTQYGLSNNANNNIYTLLEALIITWQFLRWGFFAGKKWLYYILQSLFLTIWLFDLYWFADLFSLFHHYRIYYAIVLVLICLASVNRLAFDNTQSLFRNTRFLVYAAFIILYTFKIITESFWLYGLKHSDIFLFKVYGLFAYLNLIINLLFIPAVLWIPKKPRFITFT